MTEEVTSFSKDKVMRDLQAKVEHDFSHFAPLSLRFDAIVAQPDSKFSVSFKVITYENITAGFIDDVWYENDGQLNVYDLERYD